MKTVRRLLHGEIVTAISLVLLAFLGLFSFFDWMDELPNVGRPSPLRPETTYDMSDALLTVALQLPSRLYELMPIAVLIGTVYALARLARDSEFTVLRTSRLAPTCALRLVTALGVIFAALTFVVGDYVAPVAERYRQLHLAQLRGPISIGQTGVWLRERTAGRQSAVNVRALAPDGTLRGVRLFVFDERARVREMLRAASGTIDAQARVWHLHNVERLQITDAQHIQREHLDTFQWPSALSTEMLNVALLRPERMRTWDLWQYGQHLRANAQSAERYEIAFWRKLLYPLGCVVMVILALPFAYLHLRTQTLSAYVFVGVMIGMSYFVLNTIFGHIGYLQGWQPWLAAAAPSALFLLLSLLALAWLVLRR